MSNKNCGGFTHSTQVGFDKDQACGDISEVSSCLGKEIVNLTIDVWDDPGCDGDNVVRIFNKDECVYYDGYFYWSLEDMNVDMPPTAKWSEGSTKCEMLKPYSLVDCSGKELPSGASVASCEDLDQLVSDLPKLENCSGTEISGPVVQCDEFSAKFAEALADTDNCLDPLEITDACSIQYAVFYTDSNGCTKLAKMTEGATDLMVAWPSHIPEGDTVSLPHAGDSPVTGYYTPSSLQTDIAAGSVDMTKLDKYKIACGEITLNCPATVAFQLYGNVPFDPTAATSAARFIRSIDGVIAANGNSYPTSTTILTSNEASFDGTWYEELPAGTHTICTYVIGYDNSLPMTPINLTNKPGLNTSPDLIGSLKIG